MNSLHTWFQLTWSVAFGFLMVQGFIAGILFLNNRERLYLYYSLYCITTAFYLFIDLFIVQSRLEGLALKFYNELIWYIQTVFYNFLVLFALEFLNIRRYYTKLYHRARYYLLANLAFSAMIFMVSLFFTPDTDGFFFEYFLYLFMPVQIGIALLVLVKSFATPEQWKYFFVGAGLIYIVLATASMVFFLQGDRYSSIFFFVALIIESGVFGLGLGYRIRILYHQRLQFQEEKNRLQNELQLRLENQLSRQQQEYRLLKEKHDLQNLVSSLNSRVFQSQMNSHFIFNVINSIKLFILERDMDNANRYLGLFSKFLRSVLEGSMNDYCNLTEEIATIKLYLDLEKMRFNHEFVYQIDVDANICTEDYVIPPLLLQPFVENAIKHGLLQKEGDKQLHIKVNPISDGVCISIRDNGLGRKHARQLNARIAHHKSYGLTIVRNRLDLFNERFKKWSYFEIKDHTGHEAGTEVLIYLGLTM